jgi:hypothetical protein
MMKNFDHMQAFGKDGVDATMQSFAATSKGLQVVASECADYARKSFEQSNSTVEKLMGARTIERAVEVQSEYLRGAYDSFVAQAAKFGEIYADVAKQAYKPIETYAAKVAPTA